MDPRNLVSLFAPAGASVPLRSFLRKAGTGLLSLILGGSLLAGVSSASAAGPTPTMISPPLTDLKTINQNLGVALLTNGGHADLFLHQAGGDQETYSPPPYYAPTVKVFSSTNQLVASFTASETAINGELVQSAAIATLKNGGFVVTWCTSTSDGNNGLGAYYEVFANDGTPADAAGSRHHSITSTSTDGYFVNVAGMADGGFVAILHENNLQRDVVCTYSYGGNLTSFTKITESYIGTNATTTTTSTDGAGVYVKVTGASARIALLNDGTFIVLETTYIYSNPNYTPLGDHIFRFSSTGVPMNFADGYKQVRVNWNPGNGGIEVVPITGGGFACLDYVSSQAGSQWQFTLFNNDGSARTTTTQTVAVYNGGNRTYPAQVIKTATVQGNSVGANMGMTESGANLIMALNSSVGLDIATFNKTTGAQVSIVDSGLRPSSSPAGRFLGFPRLAPAASGGWAATFDDIYTDPDLGTTAASTYEVGFTPTNAAPTDITLSSSSLNQTAATAGATIGTLTSTDSDSGETFTYALVTGTGSTNNASFTIASSTLKIGSTGLNAGSYAVRIQTTDSASNTFAKQFTITVVDNVAPLAPSTPALAAGSDTGTSASDNITNLATPTFTGTAESGSTVRIYDTDGTTQLGSATATGGTWSITSSTLSGGSHTITAKATDAASNTSIFSNGLTITVDTTAPAVSSVSVPANATYRASQNLDFTVNYPENITVTGTPFLTVSLDLGGSVQASYVSGSGTSALLFRYTIVSGNSDATGISVGSNMTLNGGTVRDTAGNNATLTLNSISTTANVYVDAIAPSVSSINRVASSPNNGSSVSYSVTFTEGVTGVDATDFTATAVTGSPASTGISVTPVSAGVYTVTINGVTGDGTIRLDLNASGTGITDTAGNAISGGYASGQTYTVDHTAPTVSSTSVPSNGTYIAAQNLDFTVNLSEPVTVNTTGGTPYIGVTLDTGGSVRASYLSTSGTTMTFRYTVVSGNADANGITVGSAIVANGGTLKDAAGNDMTLTLNSVGSTAAILVDAIAPTLSSVGVPANATYIATQNLDFTVNYSEAVVVTGSPYLSVTLDTGGTVQATYLSGTNSSTLTFRYTVASGNADATGITLGSSITLNGGTLKDPAGNNAATTLSNVGSTASVLVDAIAPTVSSIVRQSPASSSTNATSVTFGVTFSESVTGVDANDFTVFTSGSASGSVTAVTPVSGSAYSVTVSSITGAGNVRLDLKSSATGITDVPGNAISGGFTGGQTYTLDTVAPTVSSVSVPANGTYKAGQNLDFTVNFSEAAVVSGTPSIPVSLDAGGTVNATYLSGSGTSALVFRYTVVSGNMDQTGIDVGSTIRLNGGSIQDTATNNAALTLNSISTTANVFVDAIAPSIGSVDVPANGTYKADGHLDFTVHLSENTIVTGTPSLALTLDTGGTVSAGYFSGSGSNSLVFRYTIVAGNADNNGIVLGSSIALNGGTLRDAAGNDATATLSNVGALGAVLVDGVAPTVSSIVRVSNASTNAPSVDYTVTFSEPVAGVTTNAFTLTKTGTANATIASLALVSGSTYTVTLSSVSGDGNLTLNLAASGTGITDTAGNPISGGFTGGQTYALDHTAPTISSVTVPSNGTYAGGQNLDFTVHLGEAAIVDTTGGTPFIPVTLDTGGTVQAVYLSGSGTTALVFRYTVATGNLDSTGIVVGNSIVPNGGTLRDAVGNDVTATLNGLPSTAGILVDAIAPTVASVTAPSNGTYATGATLTFTVSYSEAVTVDTTGGTPYLSILLGTGGPAHANYVSGSGSSTLTFTYTVAAGQEDTDGIVVSPGIVLNGGTMRDGGGNNAVLTTTAFSTAGILIDALAPTVSSIGRQTPATASTSKDSVVFRVTFSEKVTGVDSSDFVLTTTGQAAGTIGTVTSVSQSVYDVAVGSLTRGGTLRLDLKANATVLDLAENPTTAAFTGGDAYTLVTNRPPSFTSGGDVSAAQDAGAQTIAWATEISAGAEDEASQVLHFTATVDDPTLFTVAPAIAPDGTLTFTPAPKASGTATVTVTLFDDGGGESDSVESTTPITFKLAVTTYDEEPGTYNGLAQSAPDTTPSNDKTGLIRVVVGKKGVFTGTLKLAGKSFALRGTFDKGGVAHFGKPSVPTFTLKRAGKSALTLALKLDVGQGTDKLTGTLKDGLADFAVIDADRALYTSKKNPKAPFLNVPATVLGRYTIVFAAKDPGVQQMALSEYPQGDGVAILIVNSRGVARIIGTLADGTVISYSNALSKDNVWPLYFPMAGGKGSISGPAHFRDTPDVSDIDALNIRWFKPASTAKLYPAGWLDGLQTDLLGSKFLPPLAATKTSIFTGLPAENSSGNATVTMTDGGLTGPLVKAINISPKNVVTAAAKDAEKLTMTVLFPSENLDQVQTLSKPGLYVVGRFTGSFVHPVTHLPAPMNGVIFQKQKAGFGYFMGGTECGAVVLDPQ